MESVCVPLHSLGFVRAIHVRASPASPGPDPRIPRRRDNTDGRIALNQKFLAAIHQTASIRCGARNATIAQIQQKQRVESPCSNTNQLLTSMASFSSPTTSNMRDPC